MMNPLRSWAGLSSLPTDELLGVLQHAPGYCCDLFFAHVKRPVVGHGFSGRSVNGLVFSLVLRPSALASGLD